MATIQLQFSTIEQLSLQVGDIAYYATMEAGTTGGFQIEDSSSNLILIGEITNINQSTSTITCDIGDDTPYPTTSSFIFFTKDNSVNTSSLVGYYGSAKFVNNAIVKAEMFATSCEISESSK